MNAKATMYTLATGLVVVSAAAMTSSRSWFEAYTSGARTVALRGQASYGSVGAGGSDVFVVTLGANAPEGAVLFTRADGRALTPGSYPLDEDPARGVQALVITGPATRPTGAYRARSGTLTIGGMRRAGCSTGTPPSRPLDSRPTIPRTRGRSCRFAGRSARPATADRRLPHADAVGRREVELCRRPRRRTRHTRDRGSARSARYSRGACPSVRIRFRRAGSRALRATPARSRGRTAGRR